MPAGTAQLYTDGDDLRNNAKLREVAGHLAATGTLPDTNRGACGEPTLDH